MREGQTDKQKDGRTDGETDGQMVQGMTIPYGPHEARVKKMILSYVDNVLSYMTLHEYHNDQNQYLIS